MRNLASRHVRALALGVALISLQACSSSSVPASVSGDVSDVSGNEVAAVPAEKIATPEEASDAMDTEAVTFRVLGMMKAVSGAT